ncbi:MAG: winged helix-turn-helix transcriptional regulator [Hyphomonadaceae bacterium]|nr:winged helix-turn-helix transcriptional regulator [Clostridia bacterium]
MSFENIHTTISVFKALSDLNRLKIIEMLSNGEQCACKLLEQFPITQPTLSHHMKVLMECELVCGRKDGIWMHYSLNREKALALAGFFNNMHAQCIDNNAIEPCNFK